MDALNQAPHRRHAIRVEEDVGALRRAVAEMVRRCGGIRPGEAELVATELATNIVRHAPRGGYVLTRPLAGGIELLAVDRGPGGARLDRPRPAPLRRGGLGVGLASVARLASRFDLYSAEGAGTVVLARLGGHPRPAARFRWGAVNVPLDGEGVSGDAWAVAVDGRLAAVVVDGLGHGAGAHEASLAAIAAFGERPLTDLPDFVRRAHEAMRATRGGVIGVCSIDPESDELTYAGIGNIGARVVVGGQSHGLLSRAGTMGTQATPPRVHLVQQPWGPDATLVAASDGLRGHWDPRAYPGLLQHDPVIVAATLQRDHARGTDDVTVLVVQDLRGQGR